MNRQLKLAVLSLLASVSTLSACADSPDAGGGPSRDGDAACVGRGCGSSGGDTGADVAADVPVSDDGADSGGPADATDGDSSSDDVVVPPDATPDTPRDTRPIDYTDTDEDGITDVIEGDGDADEDGIPNIEDLDSDGDGIPDSEEYRRTLSSGQAASDIDRDGVPDFLDLDSDGDTLLDEDESGCPGSTSRTSPDSDDDSFLDMVEVAFGSDPCDPDSDITPLVDFYFELPFEDPPETAELPIDTSLESGDVVFNMDVTGSMGGAITSLRNSLSTTIIPQLGARISDIGIAVSSFADFPCDTYGNEGDLPFRLVQRITTEVRAAQSAAGSLRAAGGGDLPESGIESLYQIATGIGREEPGCSSFSPTPAFDNSRQLVAGIADGTVGGAGFRESQVRVVVHITDVGTQARGQSGYPYGATRAEAYDALEAINVRVIGIAVGSSGLFGGFTSEATNDLIEATQRTGGVVEPCAWGPAADRPTGCGVTQCCTGVNGAGEAPRAGLCPLVFKNATSFFGSGGGIDGSVLSGIEALLGGTEFDITAVLRRDEVEFAGSGLDTTCFINSVRPLRATTSGCAADPVPADTDGDGELDGFTGVAPGSSVTFEIEAQNDCVEQLREPQVFVLYIDLITSDGDSLGTRVVTVLVPPLGAKD